MFKENAKLLGKSALVARINVSRNNKKDVR